MKKGTVALLSYWLLFVIGPVGVVLALMGLTGHAIAVSVVILLVLLLIGEHGFRLWKQLWHIP